MSKSIQEQLQAALAAGDLEKAQALAVKLPKPKPTKPAKAPKKAAGTQATKKPRKSSQEPSRPLPEPSAPGTRSDLILPAGYGRQDGDSGEDIIDFRDYRRGNAGSAHDPRTTFVMPERQRQQRIDPNTGRVRREARRESIRIDLPVVVPLPDNGRGGYDEAGSIAAKIDKANGRNDAPIAYRAKQKRIRIGCSGCRQDFVVYESDLIPIIDDEGHGSDWMYKCSRCCKAGR